MSLHRKCVICLILVCTLICTTRSFGNDLANNINGAESGEDENLKEALLLVELMKNGVDRYDKIFESLQWDSSECVSEKHFLNIALKALKYTRALRENFLLRQKMVEATNEPPPPEEPTCASTTKLSSSKVNVPLATKASRATTSRQPATTTTTRATTARRSLGLIANFSDLSRRKAIQNIPVNKNFRRRMPSNYLVNSDALQSLRREEEVSEDPAASEPPETGPEAETVAAESDAPTDPPETTAAAAADKTDAPKSENAVKNKDEPVLSQVADELVSEIKDDKQRLMLKNTVSRTRRTTRNTRYLSAIKPTLKIHLAKSTRLAVPLSKNNAFCFYNPKNALCRTSV